MSWSPLSSQYYNSDELEGYSIHYEANNVRINSSDDVPVGPSTTTRLLTGLHERVAYTISVAAVNVKGVGPYSSGLTVITSGHGKGDHSLARPYLYCSVHTCIVGFFVGCWQICNEMLNLPGILCSSLHQVCSVNVLAILIVFTMDAHCTVRCMTVFVVYMYGNLQVMP